MLFARRGLTHCDRGRATAGFTLFAPVNGDAAYLLDIDGEVVHRWSLGLGGINFCELLPNGNTVYLGWELLDDETAERVRGGI